MTKAERTRLWENRVAEFRASGMSVSAWCAKQQISECQLHYWLKKWRAPLEPIWVPVKINEHGADSVLAIRIGSATVEVRPGFNEELLKRVVNTLVALC